MLYNHYMEVILTCPNTPCNNIRQSHGLRPARAVLPASGVARNQGVCCKYWSHLNEEAEARTSNLVETHMKKPTLDLGQSCARRLSTLFGSSSVQKTILS